MLKMKSTVNEKCLQLYYNTIKKNAVLDRTTEIELAKRIEKGDEWAKVKLIQSNLRLVVKIVKYYSTFDNNFMDSIQEGNIGLMKAIEKYDYRKGVKFSTYAAWWIKQSILRHLSQKKRAVRLPYRKEEKLRKIEKIINRYSQLNSKVPTINKIADEIGLSVKKVSELLAYARNEVSLDIEVQDQDNCFLRDVLSDFTFIPDQEYIEKAMKVQTRQALECLEKKEKHVLTYRFALNGGEKYTLKKLSDIMGISPESVRKIEMRALTKLRNHCDYLKEYLFN